MYELSSALLSAMATVAKMNVLEPRQRIPESIAKGVSRLSELFTRRGLNAGTAYFEDPQIRAGYLSYYMPVNLAKVQVLLDELQPVFSTG